MSVKAAVTRQQSAMQQNQIFSNKSSLICWWPSYHLKVHLIAFPVLASGDPQ